MCWGALNFQGSELPRVALKAAGRVTAGPLELHINPEVILNPDFMALKKWVPQVWGR